jgi:hypothetical protein
VQEESASEQMRKRLVELRSALIELNTGLAEVSEALQEVALRSGSRACLAARIEAADLINRARG